MNLAVKRVVVFGAVIGMAMAGWGELPSLAVADDSLWHRQSVDFLGTTLDKNHQPIGVVATLDIEFRIREEQQAMNVSFSSLPGKFSPLTQIAIQEGIKSSAVAAGLNPRTWDIFLTVPYYGVRIFGESLSAMVSLAVLAMANHHPILAHRVVTGKITRDGRIGAVGGIPLKIYAAHSAHIQRVIVPEDRYQEDSDWQTPFLMQVSPARDLRQAYQMLTGRRLEISKGEVIDGKRAIGSPFE
ncbi:MAG: S16 family serine protease [Nitrospirales bacterium]|nr:hypothetical protein [Nitrospirales bacterium]